MSELYIPFHYITQYYRYFPEWQNTLSGHIGKVVVSHAAVARLVPAEVAQIYTMLEALRGY